MHINLNNKRKSGPDDKDYQLVEIPMDQAVKMGLLDPGEDDGEDQDEEFVPEECHVKDKGRHLAAFKDVQGYDNEKAKLIKVCNAIKQFKKNPNLDGYVTKGIIISGAPGVGKTMFTEAILSECDVPFFEIKTREEGGKHIVATYEAAKKVAPAIVVIDDMDRLVPNNGISGFTSDASQGVLSVLLDQLDGLDAKSGVLTIATSNYYDAIDPALCRSGRMDLHISLGLPDDTSRTKILSYYLKKYKLFTEIQGDDIAPKTSGLNCAELKTLINDVWIEATGSKKTKVSKSSLISLFQKRILEIRSDSSLNNTVKNKDSYDRFCFHETGHAVVQYLIDGCASDICALQTDSNTSSGAWTLTRIADADASLNSTEKDINDMVAVMMAGRAAEVVAFGSASDGPVSDIEQSVRIIMSGIICGVYGPELVPLGEPVQATSSSPFSAAQPAALRQLWWDKQRSVLSTGEATATSLIMANIDLFNAVNKALNKAQTLSAEEFLEIAAKYGYKNGKKVTSPNNKTAASKHHKKSN